ncbi:aminotransferase class V-fold PLP-dependent enzyme [Ruminococcus flavefaciens]|uniref:aminotransferase class V-fold PLP-dependent enzyme n=1 Tax=Ruminococcus flavefaciens TaxID=1265 RepID=UPI0026F148D2|nr:aminotransferase class V-fold PLP-dependent enzyme [Ruminococcus flavefaciens]MDD7517565.1 aminotransferase class V-fold PLP-dependent enzyme [Ruminococcus flavefaciens]MDY5690140.1 aminotransferase class V-fold PLP-dependent enzyme [Ruminococcus flavefaciens]
MINFDNAATTYPKPISVRRAANEAIQNYGGNAGRGGHELAMRTSEALYSARETAAEFFGAQPENTIFTLNCTHALNMAIQGVMKDGGHLIISSIEHNSAARPSFTLAAEKRITLSIAEIFPDTERTVESFRKLIRSDTKAIVCTLAGNVTGQLMPYREIASLCRENGICFIADGAQACGIYDIKLKDGINILCTAGHKGLYGITGTGLLITDGKFPIYPIIQGGTGSDSLRLFQPDILPDSLESGTPNIIGAVTVGAGIRYINSYGIDRIRKHEEKLCRLFMSELENKDGITIYRDKNAEYAPIVSFNINGLSSEEAASILADRGFCLRAGFHCSALAHASLGTKNGTVRFAPSVFNTETEVYKLVYFVKSLKNLQNS